MTVYNCPDCGEELVGTMLEPNLYCEAEGKEIPNYLLDADTEI